MSYINYDGYMITKDPLAPKSLFDNGGGGGGGSFIETASYATSSYSVNGGSGGAGGNGSTGGLAG